MASFDISNHYLLCLLFIVGLVAGMVDAIVGGGGLITLPALFGVGLPPSIAIGTNKLQAFFGTFSATLSFYRKKMYSIRTISKGIIPILGGALLGAIVSQSLSVAVLSNIMPFLLLFILTYVILAPKFGSEDLTPKMNEIFFYLLGGILLGFYDGFFGPGVGSLWIFALSYFLGYNLLKASAYTKVFNLVSNVVATVCFIIGGNINYKIAVVMAMGQFIGGKIGTRVALKGGFIVIRPLFMLVSAGVISMLIYKNSPGDQNNLMMFGCFLMGLTIFVITRWLKNNGMTLVRFKHRPNRYAQQE
ncbi:MAG TPA: TSUP family transporter [Candidatus Babeliales bacterium]|nr:TSUP family transporter [Candidatus Babeliales bacterium]